MVKTKKRKSKKERKLERELLYIVGFVVLLVIVFLIASSIFERFNRVEYEGLIFTKERFQDIPVFRTYYYFRAPDNQLIQYNLFVRNDPRTNDVPIEGDPIKYNSRNVYVTLDTSYLRDCEDTVISIASLTRFLNDNQLNVKSGNMDFTEAAIHNQEHITCENSPDSEVIQVSRGDSTKIEINGMCKSISVGEDCRILEAIEKFEIHSFLDAQSEED